LLKYLGYLGTALILPISPEHEKMGKGVTLSVEELKKLRDLLNEMKL